MAGESTELICDLPRADTKFRRHMDPVVELTLGGLFVPESPPIFATPVDTAICEDRSSMDEGNWPQLGFVRHAYFAAAVPDGLPESGQWQLKVGYRSANKEPMP